MRASGRGIPKSRVEGSLTASAVNSSPSNNTWGFPVPQHEGQ